MDKHGVNEIAATGRADPETEAALARCGHQALLAAGGIGDPCLLEQHNIIVVQLFDQQFQSLVLEVVFPRCARILRAHARTHTHKYLHTYVLRTKKCCVR